MSNDKIEVSKNYAYSLKNLETKFFELYEQYQDTKTVKDIMRVNTQSEAEFIDRLASVSPQRRLKAYVAIREYDKRGATINREEFAKKYL